MSDLIDPLDISCCDLCNELKFADDCKEYDYAETACGTCAGGVKLIEKTDTYKLYCDTNSASRLTHVVVDEFNAAHWFTDEKDAREYLEDTRPMPMGVWL